MPSVVFNRAARAELLEARDWYNARNAVAAAGFSAEIEALVERIGTGPHHFPVVHRDVRRARCRRFPYSLFFRVTGATVHVIACFHSSRNPLQWQQRS